MEPKIVGYICQDIPACDVEKQSKTLFDLGCHRVINEGKDTIHSKDGLARVISELSSGDMLAFFGFQQLGDNAIQVLLMLKQMMDAGIQIRPIVASEKDKVIEFENGNGLTPMEFVRDLFSLPDLEQSLLGSQPASKDKRSSDNAPQNRGQGRPKSLSDTQVAEIKRRLSGGEKAIALAKEFNVNRSIISRLK